MYQAINSDADRVKFAREAASVLRTHAQPGIGPHYVGMHSFNMLTMLRILKPDASSELIWAVVEHDLPERLTGDIPHPAKSFGIQNDNRQNQCEVFINTELFGWSAEKKLNEEDQSWKSGLDMLEFYCWCRDQIKMGNETIRTKIKAVEMFMVRYQWKYPAEIIVLYEDIRQHDWETMPDLMGE